MFQSPKQPPNAALAGPVQALGAGAQMPINKPGDAFGFRLADQKPLGCALVCAHHLRTRQANPPALRTLATA